MSRRTEGSVVADGVITVEEVMAFLSVSRSSVYELMGRGDLPYVKIGRSRRVPRRAVVELAASNMRVGGDGGRERRGGRPA